MSGSQGGAFHIPSLDGIRALSFLLVFVGHAGLGHIVPGGFGVTVFFYLSGFLITTLLRMEQQGAGRISLRDFYLRRALRIWPPFYTVLFLAIGLTLLGLLPGQLRLGGVMAQLLHFTNYWGIQYGGYGMPVGTGVYWSLAVEEHFYLVFPCLFILLQRSWPEQWRRQARVLLALCVAVLAWRFFLVLGMKVTEYRTYMGSDTRIDSILFGCALALGANPMLDRLRIPDAVWRRWLVPAGVAVLLFSFLYRAPWFRETLRYTLQGIALTPLFVVAMREPQWGYGRLLNLPVLRHVGELSYSLYLVHHMLLYGFEAWLPALHPVPRALLALGVSLALSEAIHRLIEKPCARLRRKLAHAKGTKVAPPAAAPAAGVSS